MADSRAVPGQLSGDPVADAQNYRQPDGHAGLHEMDDVHSASVLRLDRLYRAGGRRLLLDYQHRAPVPADLGAEYLL